MDAGTSSSSDEMSSEQSPPKVQTKHYKQRWNVDELQTFNRIFASLSNKEPPRFLLLLTSQRAKMAFNH